MVAPIDLVTRGKKNKAVDRLVNRPQGLMQRGPPGAHDPMGGCKGS